MNEAETRAEHIDPALKASGWGVVDGSRILREYHITPGRIEGGGRKGKAEIADYVLVYKNTKLAVVEAKAWGKELTEGVAQAKSYAGNWRSVSPTRRTDKGSTRWIWRRARRAMPFPTRLPMNCGA
jgi:type I site-specific restriction endonuclease